MVILIVRGNKSSSSQQKLKAEIQIENVLTLQTSHHITRRALKTLDWQT